MLLEVIRRDIPEIVADIKGDTMAAQMMRLGSTGANIMYFHRYLSSIHVDDDQTFSINAQLARQTHNHDFHFAYVQYRFYMCTERGAVWYVAISSHLYLPFTLRAGLSIVDSHMAS